MPAHDANRTSHPRADSGTGGRALELMRSHGIHKTRPEAMHLYSVARMRMHHDAVTQH